jgi:hypothetical protein
MPLACVFANSMMKHALIRLVESFDFALSLRMMRDTEFRATTESF